MDEIYDLQKRIVFYDDKITEQLEAFSVLGNLLAEVERKVRVTTLEFLQANESAKKVSLEKAEMLAATNAQKKCDYYEVVFLRQKFKVAQAIMDATQAGLSGVQSLIKYSSRV